MEVLLFVFPVGEGKLLFSPESRRSSSCEGLNIVEDIKVKRGG
jgi:hypothetical protein